MENLKEINGALNLVGCSENFLSEYCRFHITNLIFCPQAIPEVILASNEHKEKSFFTSRISLSSFFNLKRLLDGSNVPFLLGEENPFYKVASTVFNFFDNEPILAFCDQYLNDSKILLANIVFKHGNDILCLDINIGDILYMSLYNKLPIYIRKEIIDKHGVEYENTTKTNNI